MPGQALPVRAASETEFELPRDLKGFHVHLVGIAGSGMCGLAEFLLRRGAIVSGTDRRAGEELRRLAAAGADVHPERAGAGLPETARLVVRSAAIPDTHPEILAARAQGLTVWKYARMLGALMTHCEGIAVAGTHGKSTTSAALTCVLREAGCDPSFVIGAEVAQLGGGSGAGDGPHFVAEACEYDRSFLNLNPARAAILNVDEDHLDYYADLEEIESAFAEFAARIPPNGLLVINADDECCRRVAANTRARVETFGFAPGAHWHAADLRPRQGRYAFRVSYRGKTLGSVRLALPGRHNVANALAVLALAHDCGVGWETAARALAAFRGARRRLEQRGEAAGVRVVDDYAHHPTEIQATLRAAREYFAPVRLWCIFQPHQHSRTRFLLEQFADSFSLADEIIVPDIYFVRDSAKERERVCAADLVARLRARGARAAYRADFEGIIEEVAGRVRPGDVVLTMGAGDIWKVADGLLRRLRADLSS